MIASLNQLLQTLGHHFAQDQPAKPKPPGHIWLATEFHDAVANHGRPFGVFDPDRQLPYRG